MKPILPMAIAAAIILLAGCQTRVDSDVAADTAAAKGDRLGEIAGDKTMTADLMRRSHERGTFDDALALAMQDSTLAMEVLQAVKNDARLAAMLDDKTPTPQALVTSSGSKSTVAKSSGRTRAATTTRTATSRDPLDRAEQTVQKANEKIDQAARIKQQADEARRKVEGILRPR